MVVLVLSGCAPSPKYSNGPEFIEAVKNSFLDKSGWAAPVPPSDGQKPRLLTAEEKQQVLKAAEAFEPVRQWKKDKNVTGVDSYFLWIGWIGIKNGKVFLNLQSIEDNSVPQNTIDEIGDVCYPAVAFRFHSEYGDSGIAGIEVAVDLKTNKIMFADAFNASPPAP